MEETAVQSGEEVYRVLAAGLDALRLRAAELRPEEDGVLATCTDVASRAKRAGAMARKIMEEELRPHTVAAAAVRQRWDPVCELAAVVEASVKDVARRRLDAEERRRREEEAERERLAAEARARADAAETPAVRFAAQVEEVRALVPPDDSADVAPLSGLAMYSADRWTWELLDEGAVPREHLSVDRGKVTRAVRELTRGRRPDQVRGDEIPGIRIYRDKVVGIKA